MIRPIADSSSETLTASPPAARSVNGVHSAVKQGGTRLVERHKSAYPASPGLFRNGPPSVSVIIPARDAEATIVSTLDAVYAQDYPGPIEVIVADGDVAPAMSELIRQCHPEVKVIPNPECSLVPGANAAFSLATGDIIVRCDAHTTFPPGYLTHAIATLERTGAGNVGGRQLAEGTTFFERTVAMAMTTPLGVGDARHRLGGKAGPTDTAFLGVFSRETLEETGGYDPTVVRNEDYDFNYRLRKQGKTVWFDPELVVSYRPRGSFRALAMQYFNYGRGKSRVIMKHPASTRPRHLAAPGLVGGLVAGAVLAVAGVWWLLAALLLAYVLTIAGGSVIVGLRRRSLAAVLLPPVLAIMHLTWGVGFFIPDRAPPPHLRGYSEGQGH